MNVIEISREYFYYLILNYRHFTIYFYRTITFGGGSDNAAKHILAMRRVSSSWDAHQN